MKDEKKERDERKKKERDEERKDEKWGGRVKVFNVQWLGARSSGEKSCFFMPLFHCKYYFHTKRESWNFLTRDWGGRERRVKWRKRLVSSLDDDKSLINFFLHFIPHFLLTWTAHGEKQRYRERREREGEKRGGIKWDTAISFVKFFTPKRRNGEKRRRWLIFHNFITLFLFYLFHPLFFPPFNKIVTKSCLFQMWETRWFVNLRKWELEESEEGREWETWRERVRK